MSPPESLPFLDTLLQQYRQAGPWMTLAQVAGVFFAGSFVFDVIHWMLHRFMRSDIPLLRAVGSLHGAHHQFLDERLVINPAWMVRNLLLHVVPEVSTQLAVSSLFYLFCPALPVVLAQATMVVLFVGVLILRGKDLNHLPYGQVKSPHDTFLVSPSYHLQHHENGDVFFGSYHQLFDLLFGTACVIKGRTFVVTGANGAFGKPLVEMLRRAGAKEVRTLRFGQDWNYGEVARARSQLEGADVLVLAHGSKVDHAMEANCHAFRDFVELFREVTANALVAPEVWAVGSEIEAHPSFGVKELQIYSASKRAWARHARRYYTERDLTYRHIVPSAFTSPMGPGLMSGRVCAAVALFLIRRGFRYVPVTYTGVAFFNYLKFVLRWRLSPPHLPERRTGTVPAQGAPVGA